MISSKHRLFAGTRDFVQLTEFISPVDVLPYDWSFYMYDGSLTTPPCYQTVRWIVMRCPIRISLEVMWHIFACTLTHLYIYTSLALETRQAFKSFKSKYVIIINYLSFQYIDHMVQTVRFWFTWGEGMD